MTNVASLGLLLNSFLFRLPDELSSPHLPISDPMAKRHLPDDHAQHGHIQCPMVCGATRAGRHMDSASRQKGLCGSNRKSCGWHAQATASKLATPLVGSIWVGSSTLALVARLPSMALQEGVDKTIRRLEMSFPKRRTSWTVFRAQSAVGKRAWQEGCGAMPPRYAYCS